MAEVSKSISDVRQKGGRLQRRAPASIQVRPAASFASEWKIAIPLLSPLATSPASTSDAVVEVPREEVRRDRRASDGESLFFRSWQHPAGPFCYDPPSRVQMIVPQCT